MKWSTFAIVMAVYGSLLTSSIALDDLDGRVARDQAHVEANATTPTGYGGPVGVVRSGGRELIPVMRVGVTARFSKLNP